LKLTPYASEFHSWNEGGYSGACEWWEEKLGSKLTGVSKTSLRGPEGYESYTLNGWLGPAYSVPHLILTLSAVGSSVSLYADYIVRGPIPIGADQNMIDNFYGQGKR